jgi:hypothetical protein
MTIREGGQSRSKIHAAESIRCRNSDTSGDDICTLLNHDSGANERAFQHFRSARKPLAHLTEFIPTVAPMKQLLVQVFFQRLDVTSYRRMVRTKLVGCT